MIPARSLLGALFVGLAACESTLDGDYFPAAVVEGRVLSAQAEPVAGATILVWVRRGDCTDRAVSTHPSSDQVVTTDVDGGFSGTFEFISGGPVTVRCSDVRVEESSTGTVLADTQLAETMIWEFPATDTLIVDLTLQP